MVVVGLVVLLIACIIRILFPGLLIVFLEVMMGFASRSLTGFAILIVVLKRLIVLTVSRSVSLMVHRVVIWGESNAVLARIVLGDILLLV